MKSKLARYLIGPSFFITGIVLFSNSAQASEVSQLIADTETTFNIEATQQTISGLNLTQINSVELSIRSANTTSELRILINVCKEGWNIANGCFNSTDRYFQWNYAHIDGVTSCDYIPSVTTKHYFKWQSTDTCKWNTFNPNEYQDNIFVAENTDIMIQIFRPGGTGNYSLYGSTDPDSWLKGSCVSTKCSTVADIYFVITGVAIDPPILSNVAQLKYDQFATITESSTTTESNPYFRATVTDPANDTVKLQVELRPVGTAFTGVNDSGMFTSGLVASGSTISVGANNLADDSYHWRYRGINSHGATSAWTEFGTAGNTDFTVHQVPLYTQIASPLSTYPTITDEQWANKPYDGGLAYQSCGTSIAQCGCAITSSVMVLRYHGIHTTQGKAVTPLHINKWLEDNKGYNNDADPASGKIYAILRWNRVADYAGNQVKYVKGYNIDANHSSTSVRQTLDTYLAANKPVILYQTFVSEISGKTLGHFIVASDKLSSTYSVKDPSWYNTKTLNDAQNLTNKIRGYGNNLTGIRIFEPSNQSILASATFSLHSPAELFITDSSGRRLGTDPATGTYYEEIPDATYFSEKISDPDQTVEATDEEIKVAHISNASSGNYTIKVTGTGTGSYKLDSQFQDTSGVVKNDVETGNIVPDISTTYNVNYSSTDVSSTNTTPTDITAPTSSISLLGTLGTNSWYKSGNIIVTLSATDNSDGVGLYRIQYSLDGGTAWNTYSSPFTISAETSGSTIKYKAEDYVGNVETVQTQSYKLDKTNPATSVSLSGTSGTNGWYTTNVTVILVGSDNLSGISLTEYSLDNGSTWSTYSAPFAVSIEGTNTLLYRSTDLAGNVESNNSQAIKIDKTAPEGKISFTPFTGAPKIDGTDALGAPTVTKVNDNNYTITDDAGHTLKFNITPSYTAPAGSSPALLTIALNWLQYDSNSSITPADTDLSYQWTMTGSNVTTLSESINVNGQFSVTGTYDALSNNTSAVIVQNGQTTNQTISGLSIFKLTTASNNGTLGYEL